MHSSELAIIGSGNMGNSLLGGLISNAYPAKKIWIASPNIEIKNNPPSVHATQNNREAIKNADVIIFSVKPKVLKKISLELADIIQARKPLIISVAAGIQEASLQHWLGGHIPIVRAMPNTPALIGLGASGLYANKYVSIEQRNTAELILNAVGITVWLQDESLMDAVTVLSGSGPAYFFLLIEILQKAGVALGLPADIAEQLTLQTALGACSMAQASNLTATELRQQVTSPGGTTEQAISVLEKANIQELFIHALQAGKNRAAELSFTYGSQASDKSVK